MTAKRFVYTAVSFFAIWAVVCVAQPASQPSGEIYVGGQVVRGGVYPLTGPIDALKAIDRADAKDLNSDYAVQIIHTVVPGKLEKITHFNSFKALKDVPHESIMLQRDDQVLLVQIKQQ